MVFLVEQTEQADKDLDAILGWLLERDAGDAGWRWFLHFRESLETLRYFPDAVHLLSRVRSFRFRCGNWCMAASHTSIALFSRLKEAAWSF